MNRDVSRCYRKTRFQGEQTAWKEAEKRMQQIPGLILAVYQCYFCNGYHLTKNRNLTK